MRWTRAAVVAAVILAATWLQLVIGVTVGFEASNGKGFIGRIIIYPVLMLALPAWWWLLFPSAESVRRPFLTVLTIVGAGALLAVLWEVGEWFVFLRGGVEVDRLYQDTLGDEILGTTGALLAGLLVLWWRRRIPSAAAR